MNILTQNPDVWRKTIFILTYDENDGYFDHVPPFVAPHPQDRRRALPRQALRPTATFVTMKRNWPPADATIRGKAPSASAIACRWSSRLLGAAAAASARRCSTTPRRAIAGEVAFQEARPSCSGT